eukprot:jgi/Ulvmu1/11632/UM008_0036.1
MRVVRTASRAPRCEGRRDRGGRGAIPCKSPRAARGTHCSTDKTARWQRRGTHCSTDKTARWQRRGTHCSTDKTARSTVAAAGHALQHGQDSTQHGGSGGVEGALLRLGRVVGGPTAAQARPGWTRRAGDRGVAVAGRWLGHTRSGSTAAPLACEAGRAAAGRQSGGVHRGCGGGAGAGGEGEAGRSLSASRSVTQ